MLVIPFWEDVIINVVGAFIFIFLLLFLFKPKIAISPHICKGRLTDEDPAEYYFIKIINWSLFSAYEVKCELVQIVRYTSESQHMNARATPLTLVVGCVSHIPGYRPSWIRKNAPYAIRIRTIDNLNDILTNDYKSIIVKVSLKHGLTGLVKVQTREYSDISKLKVGRFKYGLKFGILN